MPKLTKEERILKEKTQLFKFYEDLPEDKKTVILPLIENAAFMKITLEDLQEVVIRDGVTEVYQNGENQHGVKQSAALQSYNALLKNYTAVIKTLTNMLPLENRLQPVQVYTPPEKTKATPEEIEEWHNQFKERLAEIRKAYPDKA